MRHFKMKGRLEIKDVESRMGLFVESGAGLGYGWKNCGYQTKGELMRKLVLVLAAVACLGVIPITAEAASLSQEHLDGFMQAIQINGYTCPSANKGEHLGNNERGMEFMVACDDSLYLYYVLVRNDDTFCVEPYADKGEKCK